MDSVHSSQVIGSVTDCCIDTSEEMYTIIQGTVEFEEETSKWLGFFCSLQVKIAFLQPTAVSAAVC